MAFPVPAHLPRKGVAPDVSTQILTKVSETPTKSLNAALAATWVAELDGSIQNTKKRIHDRIHEDLPAFEQHLSTSKSVQERLKLLSENVSELDQTLHRPETGLIPTLVRSLSAHAVLSKDSATADVTNHSFGHLRQCRQSFHALTSLVQAGQLAEAVRACGAMEDLLSSSPSPLNQANVLGDLKGKFRATRDRVEEQLSDAYSRSVLISPTELTFHASVEVRGSSTVISFPSILSSLSSASLSAHLSTLRRDLTSFYITHLLRHPTSLVVDHSAASNAVHTLRLFPSPPNTEDRTTRLSNLTTLLSFLQEQLFSALPSPQDVAFPQSLSKPVTDAVLEHLLVPSLPSSQTLLPPFLALVHQAAAFETEYVVGVLHDPHDRRVHAWADGVGGHYERKRRTEILECARVLIVAPEDEAKTTTVELLVDMSPGIATSESEPPVVAVQGEEEDAWGLADGVDGSAEPVDAEPNAWEFEDDSIPEPEAEPAAKATTNGHSHINGSTPEPEAEEDPADAWGWNDDLPDEPAEVEEESAWDDPWGEKADEPVEDVRPPPAPTIKAAKPATRLEKLANKGKTNGNGLTSPPSSATSVHSPAVASPAPAPVRQPTRKEPPPPLPVVPRIAHESYVVSTRARDVLGLVEDALLEGSALASSGIFIASSSSPSSAPGALILQSAPSVLDLYRALYPVRFASELAGSPKRAMRFANDAGYLGTEIRKEVQQRWKTLDGPVEEKVEECAERLSALGEDAFGDAIATQEQGLYDILVAADRFVETADQERFDECESAVSRLVRQIRTVAQQWKAVLNKSKYYTAVGTLVDAALSKMMEDVLALDDIPEVESHKLAELCRIMNALEGLFVEDTAQSSFVVSYVPSWLKFSYLSELLEASLVDLAYLFEESALVDFEVEELVKLVRALFADSPQRTNTIHKLQAGHPTRS